MPRTSGTRHHPGPSACRSTGAVVLTRRLPPETRHDAPMHPANPLPPESQVRKQSTPTLAPRQPTPAPAPAARPTAHTHQPPSRRTAQPHATTDDASSSGPSLSRVPCHTPGSSPEDHRHRSCRTSTAGTASAHAGDPRRAPTGRRRTPPAPPRTQTSATPLQASPESIETTRSSQAIRCTGLIASTAITTSPSYSGSSNTRDRISISDSISSMPFGSVPVHSSLSASALGR